MVLEKTLESPLDCKEIKSVHSKGNQYCIFIGRTGWISLTDPELTSCPTTNQLAAALEAPEQPHFHTWAPSECTPARRARRSTSAPPGAVTRGPRAHPRILRPSRARSLAPTWALDQCTPRPPGSPADRRTPPGPQPAARPTPPAPGLCALPGAERGAAEARVWSLPAVTSGGPRAGAEAAAAGRALPAPPHISWGPDFPGATREAP